MLLKETTGVSLSQVGLRCRLGNHQNAGIAVVGVGKYLMSAFGLPLKLASDPPPGLRGVDRLTRRRMECIIVPEPDTIDCFNYPREKSSSFTSFPRIQGVDSKLSPHDFLPPTALGSLAGAFEGSGSGPSGLSTLYLPSKPPRSVFWISVRTSFAVAMLLQ